MPAFINLQQYYLEQFLCERAAELDAIDLRWRNKVSGIEPPQRRRKRSRSTRRTGPIGSTPIG